MTRHWILPIVGALAILCSCGGKNGLVGGGQGNGAVLKSIALTPAQPTVTLKVSPPQQFVAIGTYSIGNPVDISSQMTWISADTTVATIAVGDDKKVLATAVGSGRAIITGTIIDPGSGRTFQVSTILTVVPQLTAISVSPASAQIAKGTTQQFMATGSYNDGTKVDITALVAWNSSQQAAATVSSSPGTQGQAVALAQGSTSITAALGTVMSSPASLTVSSANLVSLAVTPANSTVPLATAQQFAATGTFDDGTKQDISASAKWTSSDPSVARVSSLGTVSGTALGSTTITARSGAISNSTGATVDASSVAAVNVVPISKIATGTSSQMLAVAVFKDGSSLDVTRTPGMKWSSSDSSVVNIGASTGLAFAVGPGVATVTASLGQSGNAAVNVSDATIQSLVVAPDPATIASGTTQRVIALATFSDTSGQFQQDISSAASWTSDNPGVATLSWSNALQEVAQGLAAGSANVAASFADAHGHSASSSALLNVSNAELNGISVAPGSASITLGGGRQYLATGNFSDGTQQDLTLTANWSAGNGAIASVSPFGYAAASGPGQTSISAALGPQAGSSSLLVNPGALVRIDICPSAVADPLNNCPPLDPVVPPPPISFPKLVPYGLIAVGTYTDGSREDLTSSVRWTTSNPSIVTISNDPGIPGYVTGVTTQGVATGLVGGHVTLTAAAGGVNGTSDVIVTEATPAFLTVTPMDGTAQLGLTRQFSVLATFTDSTSEIVTPYVAWTTSDPGVVVVGPGGVAYLAGTGVATVTASIGDIAGSTTLTVQ